MALANGDGAWLLQALLMASVAQAGFVNQFLIALAPHALVDGAARKMPLAAVRMMPEFKKHAGDRHEPISRVSVAFHERTGRGPVGLLRKVTPLAGYRQRPRA